MTAISSSRFLCGRDGWNLRARRAGKRSVDRTKTRRSAFELLESRTLLAADMVITWNNALIERVEAFARLGGNDTAFLYVSEGNERLSIHSTAALLENEPRTYSNYAELFDRVEVYARSGGVDTANMYDSTGNDILNATPTATLL